MDSETSPRPHFPASTLSVDDDEYERQCREKETEYYNGLINDGGRPSHPISLGYDIAKNGEKYREILSFWQTDPDHPDSWKVYGCQLVEWESFREHQRSERKKGFSAYCQRLHDRLARHGFKQPFQLDEELYRQDKTATWIEFLNYEYWKYDISAGVVSLRQSRHDKAGRSSWTGRSWNHLRRRSFCGISDMRIS